MHAKEGMFTVESIRSKTIVDGKPPEVQEATIPTKRPNQGPAEALDNQDLLRAGMQLSGSYRIDGRSGERPLDGTIERINQKELVIKTKRDNSPGSIVWVFSRAGNSLTLVREDAEGGQYTYKVLSGSGEIIGKTVKWKNKGERWQGKQRTDIGSGSSELTAK
jgi:hypothetical protein